MTGGTEFSEAAEAPKQSEEVKESPEKQAEIKEVAEQTEKLDDATLKPKEVVEGGDYKASEALETVFVEAVAAVPVKAAETANEGSRPPSEGRSESVSDRGDTDESGSKPERDTSDSAESGSRVSREAPEAGAVAEVSAVPEISFEGSGEEGTVITEEAVEEKPDVSPTPVEQTQEGAAAEVTEALQEDSQPAMEREAAQKVPEASVARSAESQTVPEGVGAERDDGELKMVMTDKDGGSDRPVMDDGVDQVVDLHEDNQIKDQFGGLDERGESVGYQGDPAGGADGIPEIPGMIPDLTMDGFGKGGGKEVDAGLPGLDQEGELGDLADAAAPGGDATVGGVVETIKSVTGKIWGAVSSGGGQDTGAGGGGGVRGTPTPDGVENVDFDHTLGGLIPNALPNATPDDLDDESVMQPVDEDDASPKEPGIVFDRATQTDPYRQDTDEHVDVPRGTPEVEENYLIDPPDFAGGGGDGGGKPPVGTQLSSSGEEGFVNLESDKKNLADTEDLANLEASDPDGGQVPKP